MYVARLLFLITFFAIPYPLMVQLPIKPEIVIPLCWVTAFAIYAKATKHELQLASDKSLMRDGPGRAAP